MTLRIRPIVVNVTSAAPASATVQEHPNPRAAADTEDGPAAKPTDKALTPHEKIPAGIAHMLAKGKLQVRTLTCAVSRILSSVSGVYPMSEPSDDYAIVGGFQVEVPEHMGRRSSAIRAIGQMTEKRKRYSKLWTRPLFAECPFN